MTRVVSIQPPIGAIAGDRCDASLMHSLMLTPRDYKARMELKAFLGMSAHEVYVASGRAERDNRTMQFRRRLDVVATQGDARDYTLLKRLEVHSLEYPVSWAQRAAGEFRPTVYYWLRAFLQWG